MLIKNYEELATNEFRKDALSIVEAGLYAIQPEVILSKTITLTGDVFKIGKEKYNLSDYKNIFVVGIGKASFKAAEFLEKILGNRITDGAVIDVMAKKMKHIRSYEGTHPLPTEVNIKATKEIIEILKRAKKNDLVISIISGGGSSLLCLPNKMTCIDLQVMTSHLFDKGADIKEMNTLRKHTSQIHGGNLAKLAYPATVVGLIFSDIPFSDLSFVASGPTFLDKMTKEDAKKMALKYGVGKLNLCETPKDQKYFDRVKNILVLNNKVALKVMKDKAEELGYESRIAGYYIRGEAKKVGGQFIKEKINKKEVVLYGGETTVFIEKKGKGGRNLEVVLGALNDLKEDQLIISVSSDGKDHIKEAAGALGDYELVKKMHELNYEPEWFLKENQSYKFFKDLKGVIVSELTGSNVSDLILVMRK